MRGEQPVSVPVEIDDPSDERLDDFRGLKFPDRRMLTEGAGGFFIAEGSLVVRRMFECGLAANVRSVVTHHTQRPQLADILDAAVAPTYIVSPALLKAVVGFDLHRGVVASLDRPEPRTTESILADPSIRTILALEALNDFENLGSIFRSAAGLGADAILLCPQCADPLYRRCVRVSMGNVVGVPYAVTEPWPQAIATMQAAGFRVLAFTPSGTTPLKSVTRTPEDRIVIALGAEGPGLSSEALTQADARVTIPMHAATDSLNVSVAAAVALFHMT